MITFEYPIIDGTKGKINIKSIFPDEKPLNIEIGFGNGLFIFNKAQGKPDVNFIGIEFYHKGIRALAKRIKKHSLKNLIILYGEAKMLFDNSIRENEVTKLYINFPDTWPKTRHKKRRLVNVDFARLTFLKLRDKGKVHLSTDSEDYARDMLISFDGVPGYRNLAGRLKFSEKDHTHVTTKYEQKFISQGDRIYYLLFQADKFTS